MSQLSHKMNADDPASFQERPMPGHKTGPPGRRPGSLGPEGSSLPSAAQHGPPGKDRSDIRHDHDNDDDNDDDMLTD